MFLFLSELIVISLINLYCIVEALKIKKIRVRILITVLLCICFIKYPVQYIFYSSSAPVGLFYIKNLYLISIPMLTSVTYLCIQIMKNSNLKIMDWVNFIIILSIFMVFIIKAPEGITIKIYGYGLLYSGMWQTVIAIAVGLFGAGILYLTVLYFLNEKKPAEQLAYIVFFIGYIIIIIEALLYLLKLNSTSEYLTAEGIILLGVLISLSRMRIKEV